MAQAILAQASFGWGSGGSACRRTCAPARASPRMAASSLVMNTQCGIINLRLRPDSAPITCDYIVQAVRQGLYDGKQFYRSDFVIQCGLHGSNVAPPGNLSRNETKDNVFVSNTRGTCAIAHWDVPDCGNTEFFINLQANSHLDEAYGGYCVFAEVADDASFKVVDMIAEAVKAKGGVGIKSVTAE
uniref:peptidylprolyl isomerase n=1 Tax=Alexandrium monilatum TaxID=311494 RepID=A0A7S4QEL1_9DINO